MCVSYTAVAALLSLQPPLSFGGKRERDMMQCSLCREEECSSTEGEREDSGKWKGNGKQDLGLISLSPSLDHSLSLYFLSLSPQERKPSLLLA